MPITPSKYRLGQRVSLEGRLSGCVIDTHTRLTKVGADDKPETKPGVTVAVDLYAGEFCPPFEVQAWDEEILSGPEVAFRLDGEYVIPVKVLFDRASGFYNGTVPLPPMNLPGFVILFRRDAKTFTLRFDSGAGLWSGEGLNLKPGIPNSDTESWTLAADMEGS